MRAAQGRFSESIARYQRAIASSPRADLLQQLGDVYAVMGRVDDARRLHEQARDEYLASVRRGEVQFLHHLAGYYADVARNGAEAVKWARRDAELRPSPVTDDTLAWALYVNGETHEAERVVERALASGIVDSHLYLPCVDDQSGGRRRGRCRAAGRQAARPEPPVSRFPRAPLTRPPLLRERDRRAPACALDSATAIARETATPFITFRASCISGLKRGPLFHDVKERVCVSAAGFVWDAAIPGRRLGSRLNGMQKNWCSRLASCTWAGSLDGIIPADSGGNSDDHSSTPSPAMPVVVRVLLCRGAGDPRRRG